jgi:hypothetical protein
LTSANDLPKPRALRECHMHIMQEDYPLSPECEGVAVAMAEDYMQEHPEVY